MKRVSSLRLESNYDVVVAGSGPAGSLAAFHLAQAGVRVAIFEKASLPRYKTCGGGIVRRAIRLLPIDIKCTVEKECYSAELNLLASGLSFCTTRDQPIVSMTMRERFDYVLASAARDAGAILRDSCAVLDIRPRVDGIEVATTHGPVRARFVIGADGATSVVARRGGWPRSVHVMPALECEVFVSGDDFRRFDGRARFDFEVIPHGYAWVFPKRRHLSIGVGIVSSRNSGVKLKEAFARYTDRIGLCAIERLEQHGFGIPFGPRARDLMKGRVLLVGDAAGLADPLTGEGITFAIQSGELAARALLEGNLDRDRVHLLYDEKLQRTILPELRWGRLLSKLMYDVEPARRWLFRRRGQALAEAMTDVMTGRKAFREIFRAPSTYLKLLGLTSVTRRRVEAAEESSGKPFETVLAEQREPEHAPKGDPRACEESCQHGPSPEARSVVRQRECGDRESAANIRQEDEQWHAGQRHRGGGEAPGPR